MRKDVSTEEDGDTAYIVKTKSTFRSFTYYSNTVHTCICTYRTKCGSNHLNTLYLKDRRETHNMKEKDQMMPKVLVHVDEQKRREIKQDKPG